MSTGYTATELRPIVSYAYWHLSRGKSVHEVRQLIVTHTGFPPLTSADVSGVIQQARECMRITEILETIRHARFDRR